MPTTFVFADQFIRGMESLTLSPETNLMLQNESVARIFKEIKEQAQAFRLKSADRSLLELSLE